MEKIEYADINKFLVSIGLMLIIFSIVLPYYFLKEDFGIFLDNKLFLTLKPEVQSIIIVKRKQVSFFQQVIPYLSLLLFTVGIVSLIYGLIRWFKRQKRIDEKFDTELEKLKWEIKAMTPMEVIEKTQIEISEINSPSSELSDPFFRSPMIDYMNVESRIYKVFEAYSNVSFEILTQRKVNSAEIDILMLSKNKKFMDRVIEIKYFKTTINKSIIEKSLTKLSQTIHSYKTSVRRKAKPVLLFVYNTDTINKEKVLEITNDMLSFSQKQEMLRGLKIISTHVEEIEQLDISKLLKR
ncbi:hypothetical protein [Sphingobacterium sp. GVS05A]|uniref:hypothetical protein n=1 Tax=Sphingobacterium sp. GVS05A TaxID=2862679 RepID=UPI001CC196FB|nr:hypothetical protein [Sphingobacterium sp. GVS05A]